MASWHFSGGTVLRSGGVVEGDDQVADELRRAIAERAGVRALPEPIAPVPVDPSSDYLLDRLAREVAWATRTRLETHYVPDVGDAPPELRERLEGALVDAARSFPGVVH